MAHGHVIAVVNDRSGSFESKANRDRLDKALAKLDSGEGTFSQLTLEQALENERLKQDLAAADDVTVVAIGGDGTLRAVVSAMDLHRPSKLGFLPMGTMNVYARRYGIPLDPVDAVEHLLGQAGQSLHVGYLNEHLFLLQALTGPMTTLQRFREQARQRGKLRTLASKSFWRSVRKLLGETRGYVLRSLDAGPDDTPIKMRTRLVIALTPRTKQDETGLSLSAFEPGEQLASASELFSKVGRLDLALEDSVRATAIRTGYDMIVQRQSKRSMLWLLDGERVLAGRTATLQLVDTRVTMLA